MRIRLFGQYVHSQVIALALVEAGLFLLCPYIAYLVRFGNSLPTDDISLQHMLPTALAFALALFVSFLALGLYTTRQRARIRGLGLRILMAVGAAMGALAVVFYIVPTLQFGRGIMLLSGGLSVVASMLSRYVFGRVIDTDMLKKRVIIFGHSSQLGVFEKLRRRSDRRGYNVLGIVCADESPQLPAGLRRLDPAKGLHALCEELSVDEVIIALGDRRGTLPHTELLRCRLAGIVVIDIVGFLERETGRIYLEVLSPSWFIFNDGFRRDGLRQFSARSLDFIASAVLLMVTLPVILITAALIWLEDGRGGSGIFYRQDRVGFQGRVFSLLKFRSMRVDAEQPGQAQWAQKNDPRVTRIGAFIRRSRIDELPQLLNVLQGHMSFVGPRPERPQFVAELQSRIPYYGYRHSVKPGITGWAQLCYPYGASESDAMAKLQYDLYYVKNSSLLFDLGILVQTAEVVFLGKGAR